MHNSYKDGELKPELLKVIYEETKSYAEENEEGKMKKHYQDKGLREAAEDVLQELKPCPFCGGKPFISLTYFLWYDNQKIDKDDNVDVTTVGCGDCGIDIQRDTKREAIQAWNRRAQ